MIDDIDRQILTILQDAARTSNAEIARVIGMAPSGVLERIRKLEERGIIQGYTARVNPEAVGLKLLAFVQVRSDSGAWAGEVASKIAAMPEVQELHHVAGDDCFLVKVRVRDPAALGALLRDRVNTVAAVRSTRTTIVLETTKETSAVTICGTAEGTET